MRMRKAAAAAGGSRRSASSPFSRLLFYLTTTLLSLHPPLLASAATAPSDAAAMSAIASAIKPLPTNWASDPSADPCSLTSKWKGVSCSDSGRVTFLNLQKSSISGTLPPEIANLTALQSLSLQNNNLGGPLPSFSGLSALQEIYLSRNQFTSIPPTFFSGLTSLMNVSLDYNPFSNWNIPDDLSQAVNLVAFNAMNASVTGPIPPFFGKLASLQTLRLSYNSIVGGIPPEFRGSGVRELYLNNQDGTKLSGTVEVLASMTQLTDVWLQVNNFTGPIPDLSNCTDLAVLYLRDNKFTGMVPASLSTLPSLSDIQIAHNDLQGPYPDIKATVWKEGPDSGNNFCNSKPGPCDPTVMTLLAVAEAFGYPTVIAESWKGNDACANWIFITCDSQKRITVLNFGNQKFGGTISPAIANITSLKSLILSNNNLQGSIPDALTTLPQLQLIDVSNNNLSGKVPAFRSNLEFKSSGNPLLGKELPAGGGSSQSTSGGTSPADGTSEAKSGSKSSGLMIALIIVAVVLLVAGSLSSFIYYKRRQHLKFRKVQVQSPPSEPEPFKINVNHYLATAMSPSELQSQGSSDSRNGHAVDAVATFMSMQALRLATDNFSDSNVLGRGGFGVVYKGELGDGTLIAVKRMECGEMGKKGMTEFQAELAVLTKVRHRHLVALLGFCVEGIERLLVYEYMPQGTLSQHLFGGDEMGYVSLTWKQRLIIALDVARGLEYLHSLAHKSFIHRDLKPSNILLGNDMRAKVSDFGLVKLAPDGKYSVETRLAGTFGYLAPEYATTGRVTTKVDVYAFGVVLMELITGRKALDDSLSEENTHLVTWFRRVLINKGGSISKAADPSLDMTDEDDLRSLNAVAELAGHCTAREAHQRPDMGHAVNVLAPLVDQWKPSTSGAGGGNEENFDASFNGSLTQRLKRWQMNEGSSISGFGFDDSVSIRMENTQGSIPSKPEMYPHGR